MTRKCVPRDRTRISLRSRRKKGRPAGEWRALIRASDLTKDMDLVNWLKAEYGMGHGHANALVAYTLAEDAGA